MIRAAPKAGPAILGKTPLAENNPMKCRSILLACLLFSLPAAQAANTPAPPAAEAAPATEETPPALTLPKQRAETRRSKALEEQLKQVDKESEVMWLGSGDDQFMGLFLSDHSGKTFASALILHDNLQHPDWPGLVHALRADLAAHGWNTLTIALPDYLVLPVLPPPDATEEARPADDTAQSGAATATPAKDDKPLGAPEPTIPVDDSTPLVPVEYSAEQVPDLVDGRTREALGVLKEKNAGPVIIIAIGLSAGIAAKKAQTMLIQDIAGLVIIDPVQPEGSNFNTDLDAMDLRVPILDIAPEFFPRTDPAVRKHSAGRTRKDQYQQRIIRGARPDFRGQETTLVKAVRGWGEQWFRNRKRS